METARGFSDRRLKVRLDKIRRRIEQAPDVSFPRMCEGAELEGLYRFFANPKVTPEAILEDHFDEVLQLAIAEEEVLVIHDTTKFSFKSELGEKQAGFFGHFSLTLSTRGYRRPLGIANMLTWRRGDLPTEHDRWSMAVHASAERLRGARAIHVMDREGDDHKLFQEMVSNGQRFVIRLTHTSRKLVNCELGKDIREASRHIQRSVSRNAKLNKSVESRRRPTQREIHPARSQRVAELALGAESVVLKRPKLRHADPAKERMRELPEALPINIVRVWEPTPPDGEPPVEWLLATNEPISSPEEIERIVDHYRARWTVEEFIKAIKTGCAYEKRQLGDYDGLCNALATFIPIACKALVLRSESRAAPDATDALQLSPDEITVLRAGGRRKLSNKPNNREVLLAVAALGGHIKYAPDPGWLTISRGLEKLGILVAGWRLAKLQQSRDQR